MFSLESDEMTALWPNDSLTFTFFVIISNSIPNWGTFVKEVFWFNVSFSLEYDEMTISWPSFFCLIHFILRTLYCNMPRYLLWKKFFVQGLSIWPRFCCLICFFNFSNQPRYLLWNLVFVQRLSILTKLLLLDSLGELTQ